MTTSGTYGFNPAVSDVVIAAYSMCGLRRTQIVTEHLADATYQSNMLMVDFTNRNPHQFAIETQSLTLTPGTPTYPLANRTVAIAVAYISTTAGGTVTDRVLGPISASEYAAIPNKAQQGFPNSYWVNLGIPSPTITLYFVPDANFTYTLKVLSFRQMQDVAGSGGQTLDTPYRFLDAFTTGLAARLAVIYAPDRAEKLEALFEKRFLIAAEQDQERVGISITPGLGGYFR